MRDPAQLNIRRFYDRFNASVTGVDCGQMCAPHNPTGKPFCCDICQAVPAAYRQEWDYLKESTDLWHEWRGDECADPLNVEEVRAQTPENMTLLACQGPRLCQRNFRALSCRQFPFFPYIDTAYRFVGLVYEYEFETTCWVISNLGLVTPEYRQEFVQTFDELFTQMPGEFNSYAVRGDEIREHFSRLKRRFPLLHRNGGYYLVSPDSERMERVTPERFKQFGPYR